MRIAPALVAVAFACSFTRADAQPGPTAETTWAPTPPPSWEAPPRADWRGLPAVQVSDCYGRQRQEEAMPMPAPMPHYPTVGQAPSAAPSGYGMGGAMSAPRGAGAGVGASQGVATRAAPAKPRAMADAAPMAEAEASSAPPPPAPVAAASATPAREARKDRAADEYDASEEASRRPATGDMPWAPPAGPSMTWGGTVHLSNDDTASLASAQRVLWAAERGAAIPSQHIRPHELLNYFSFDSQAPAPGELFGAQGSALRIDGDTMSVGFAVKVAAPPRPALDLTLVVDRSGSMSAEGRMEYTKRAMHKLRGQLQSGDRLDLVLFDHEVCTPLKNFVVGRDDMALLQQAIDPLVPRGSTDMNAGLQTGYAVAREHGAISGRSRRVMVMTDALLNTGEIREDVVSEVARGWEHEQIRLTGVGVGSEFNDKILDQLTEKGKGAYVFLGSEKVVDRLFGAGFPALVHTVAHNVRFAIDLPQSLGVEKFYGEEISRDIADIQPVHAQAGTSQLFLQDLRIRPGSWPENDAITFRVSYEDALTGQPRQQAFTRTVGDLLRTDARNVAKGRALMAWTDLLLSRSMGGEACGEPFSTFKNRIAGLTSDVEVQWVDGLVSRACPSWTPVAYVPQPIYVPSAGWKVKIDSDVAIAEVDLDCPSGHYAAQVDGADNVARFDSAPVGSCRVTLHGAVPMTAAVQVPSTGGQLRCVVRGGRIACN